jgi:N-acetylneuraminate synthase/N,N'-diacetyllegionaminate synthase
MIRIGPARIGDGCRTYIIAEAGVNHDGSLEKALQLVDAAVAAGADAVKFQLFRADELATHTAPKAGYQKTAAGASQRAMLGRLELSDEAFERVAARCRNQVVEFLATPFGLTDVERLRRLRVRAIKIASTDLNHTPLLRRVAATRLPLIVSTGAATEEEIADAAALLGELGVEERLVLLHCVSAYPTPLEHANLRRIRALHAAFGVPVGFSDHTTSTQTGAWAVATGACVLEKHFTLDRSAPGPDHAHSLDPAGLRDYIRAVRRIESALGSGGIDCSDIEAEVRTVARKSVVAARRVPAGTVLTAEMLAIKRPGGGIEPGQLERLVGRRIARDIPADTVLTWDMLVRSETSA